MTGPVIAQGGRGSLSTRSNHVISFHRDDDILSSVATKPTASCHRPFGQAFLIRIRGGIPGLGPIVLHKVCDNTRVGGK